jgi:geranylgeranyl diphosphate synthase type II
MLAVVETFEKDRQSALSAACAIEMVHTYSLIHDDLPAMDNDDYRRGKLTNHKVYGDAIAILAGDALLTYAFEVLTSQAAPGTEKQALLMISELSKASGFQGMIGGQVADIQAEGSPPNRELLNYIHKHKTGDLLTASIRIGAIFAGATADQMESLTRFADNVGLAFQIQDDILDVIGDEQKLGKQVGADAALGKLTYPSVFGMQASQQRVEELTIEALAALDSVQCDTTILRGIADYLLQRQY